MWINSLRKFSFFSSLDLLESDFTKDKIIAILPGASFDGKRFPLFFPMFSDFYKYDWLFIKPSSLDLLFFKAALSNCLTFYIESDWLSLLNRDSSLRLLGDFLYIQYGVLLFLVGLILLVALIGVTVLLQEPLLIDLNSRTAETDYEQRFDLDLVFEEPHVFP